MDKLLCGLGFHQWNHLGYDVWTEKSTGSFSIFCFRSHKKCVNCQKLILSKSVDGIPPEVEINSDNTAYCDHSIEGEPLKTLFERG